MKRILVTGAGGYIGRHIVSSLLDMGADVIAAQSGVVVYCEDYCYHNWSKDYYASCDCGGGYGAHENRVDKDLKNAPHPLLRRIIAVRTGMDYRTAAQPRFV